MLGSMNYKSDPLNKNIRQNSVSQTVSVTRANSDSNVFVFDGQGDNGLVTDLYDVSQSLMDQTQTFCQSLPLTTGNEQFCDFADLF